MHGSTRKIRGERRTAIERGPGDVDDASEQCLADGDRQRLSGARHGCAADDPSRRTDCDRAHLRVAELRVDDRDHGRVSDRAAEGAPDRRSGGVEGGIENRPSDGDDAPPMRHPTSISV